MRECDCLGELRFHQVLDIETEWGTQEVGVRQVVENPLDILGIVDVTSVVEHRGFYGELSHGRGKRCLLGKTKPPEFLTIGGELGMALEMIHHILQPHDMTSIVVDDGPVCRAGYEDIALLVIHLELAKGIESVGTS